MHYAEDVGPACMRQSYAHLQRAAALRRGVGEIACPDVVGQVDLELTVDAVTIATASFVHAIVKDRFWSTEVDRDCAFLIRAQGVGFVAVLASPALITFCGIANAAVVLGRKVETWDRKNWLVDVLASQVYVWSRMGAVCLHRSRLRDDSWVTTA